MGGILKPNPGKCYTNETDYLVYDYPSVSHISYIANQENFNIIFGIPASNGSETAKIYKNLHDVIKGSYFGLLHKNDSNGIIDLVVKNYKVRK